MKKTLLSAAVAATLVAHAVCAQEVVKPGAAVAKPAAPATVPAPATAPAAPAKRELARSDLLEAIHAAVGEIGKAWAAPASIKAKVASLTNFSFSPETAKKLEAQFGRAQPLHMGSRPAAGGTDLNILLEPLAHTDAASGARVSWGALNSTVHFDRKYRQAHSTGTLPWFKVEHPAGIDFSATGMRYTGDASPTRWKFWSGSGNMSMSEAVARDRSGAALVRLSDLTAVSKTAAHGAMLDMDVDVKARALAVGKTELGPLRYAIAVKNLDGKALSDFQQRAQALQVKTYSGPAEQQAAFVGEASKSFWKMLTPSTVLELRELSVVFDGAKAVLTGQVHFEGATRADFEKTDGLWKKVVAHFDVRVPMAIVRSFARITAASVPQAPGAQKADPAVVAKAIEDDITRKMLETKMVRIEQDVAISSLDLRLGALSINSQPVPLPNLTAAPAKK